MKLHFRGRREGLRGRIDTHVDRVILHVDALLLLLLSRQLALTD